MNKLKWVKHALLEEELKTLETTRFVMDKISIRGNMHFYNGGTWTDSPDKPDLGLFYRVLAQYPEEQFLRLYNINDLSAFIFIKKPFDVSSILINFSESNFSLHFNHCKIVLPLDYFINHERLDPMDPLMMLFCKELREEKDFREKLLNSINNIYDKLTDEQENNRQGMEDYEEIYACINDDPEAIKWLEKNKKLYSEKIQEKSNED